jgi:hypothetical protein
MTKVRLHVRCRLEALLCRLREQFHHDGGDRPPDAVRPGAWRNRQPREVAVDPLHRVAGCSPPRSSIRSDGRPWYFTSSTGRAAHEGFNSPRNAKERSSFARLAGAGRSRAGENKREGGRSSPDLTRETTNSPSPPTMSTAQLVSSFITRLPGG